MAEMTKRVSSLGGACFAEEFIEGREFNLSLLAGDSGPIVLPPAEICFEGFDSEKPRIVDYQAKWAEDSFEYKNTPRSFDFKAGDSSLLAELEKLARYCWEVFSLRGYARVDFRVDSNNQPWILEINANPCLSPDAGFAAALSRAGLSFTDAVQAIVADAGRGRDFGNSKYR
jgi:D-alanine-D-alanine ligase